VKAFPAAGPSVELFRWRTVDIVVVALLAVAFGVVFWVWGTYVWAWGSFLGPQTESLITGVWLLPAVVCPLIVRRPGAALFGELVAAFVSAMLGSYWGLDTLLSGLLQGAGAEAVFLITMYRAWNPVVAILAAAGAGIGEASHDLIVSYGAIDIAGRAAIGAAEIVSAIAIVGVGGWMLVRALRQTGALQTFPSGE
jgi:energy-coupling factor transport system substrate-specific component